MKHYQILMGSMIVVFLVFFGIAQWQEIAILEDPKPWLQTGNLAAALIGVGLLIADVALPAPSSIIMIAHGGAFGILWGTILNLIGSVGASMVGFTIGRQGGPIMVRLVPKNERERANRLLGSYGRVAIIVTRPVPILAESMAIIAGTTSMTWRDLILASFFGSIPAAFLYALTGATASGFSNSWIIFGIVLLVAAIFWFLGKRIGGAERTADI